MPGELVAVDPDLRLPVHALEDERDAACPSTSRGSITSYWNQAGPS